MREGDLVNAYRALERIRFGEHGLDDEQAALVEHLLSAYIEENRRARYRAWVVQTRNEMLVWLVSELQDQNPTESMAKVLKRALSLLGRRRNRKRWAFGALPVADNLCYWLLRFERSGAPVPKARRIRQLIDEAEAP